MFEPASTDFIWGCHEILDNIGYMFVLSWWKIDNSDDLKYKIVLFYIGMVSLWKDIAARVLDRTEC